MTEMFCPFVNGPCVEGRCRFHNSFWLDRQRVFEGCALLEAAAALVVSSHHGKIAMMSESRIRIMYNDARFIAENAPDGSPLQVRAAIEADLLKRLLKGGMA